MIPLRCLKTDAETGCRVGGAAPVGLESQFVDSWTQYFGTFPLLRYPGKEFSIFHRFDPRGNDESRDLISFNNQILEPNALIWVVVHGKSVRSKASPNMFEARAFDMGPESIDEMVSGGGGDCKLGGNCYVWRDQVSEAVPALEASGYEHLLQIGEVGSDLIKGFPWDPGWLNVWAADPLDPATCRFCVQQ